MNNINWLTCYTISSILITYAPLYSFIVNLLITPAFSSSRAEDRRTWLLNDYDNSIYIDPSQTSITYEQFVRKELIHFSFADNQRSIPSAIDGLKPSQRKVLHGCFKRNADVEVKVVQLAGYIAEKTCYHHGEASLYATIVNMAQDFVGSNNIPLLAAGGQFGTRAQVLYNTLIGILLFYFINYWFMLLITNIF